jgi:hypothetical protein
LILIRIQVLHSSPSLTAMLADWSGA